MAKTTAPVTSPAFRAWTPNTIHHGIELSADLFPVQIPKLVAERLREWRPAVVPEKRPITLTQSVGFPAGIGELTIERYLCKKVE
jgi:hypothetical protein